MLAEVCQQNVYIVFSHLRNRTVHIRAMHDRDRHVGKNHQRESPLDDCHDSWGLQILTFYVIPQRPVSIRMLAEVCQILVSPFILFFPYSQP
jgi:hypothetical protein